VTHHGPHPNSIHPRFRGNVANPAFASDLSSLMGRPSYGSTATRTPASTTRSPAPACSPTRAAIPAATR
jgi:hypothetical protein